MEALEDLIYEDNRALEKEYFDPFVKDRTQISKVWTYYLYLKSLKRIEEMLKRRGEELEDK